MPRSLLVILALAAAVRAPAAPRSELEALHSAEAFSDASVEAAREAAPEARIPPTVASFQEAADLFRSGDAPTLEDIAGWHAGVEYIGDSPYLPNASAFTTSADGVGEKGPRVLVAIAASRPSDWFYTLSQEKIDLLRTNFRKKAVLYSVARVEPRAIVSDWAFQGQPFRSAVRKTPDGRLAVATYRGFGGPIAAVGVYDKKIYPAPQSSALVGVLQYHGGFASGLTLPVTDPRRLASFRLRLPSAATVDVLEAGVVVGGVTTLVKPGAGGTYVLPSATPVDAIVVTLNGPTGTGWQIPVYAGFEL